jgi:hypothetical protein
MKMVSLATLLLAGTASAQVLTVNVDNPTTLGGQYSSVCENECWCPELAPLYNNIVPQEIVQAYDEECQPNGSWYALFIVDGGEITVMQAFDGALRTLWTTPMGVAETPLPISCWQNRGITLLNNLTFFEVMEWSLTENGFRLIMRDAADSNRSGVVNAEDIFDYLCKWFGGSAAADMDTNSVINIPDIFFFLTEWFEG